MRKILVTSHQNSNMNQKNHWLERVAQSRHLTIQQEVESQQNFHLRCSKKQKRGPALKNRLVGDAEMCKGLLDRESLRATDGVKYFRNTLRPHFMKGAQNVFLWRFYQFNRARRGSLQMVMWIGRLSLFLQRLKRRLGGQLADVRPE